MRTLLPLLLLAACRFPANSTAVMHRFSDDALLIADRAAPGADWSIDIDPARTPNVPYTLPHTEVVVLGGHVGVEEEDALFESLEIEAMRTLLRENMIVDCSRGSLHGELRIHEWRYHWPRGQGVLRVVGSRRASGRYILAVTIHESAQRS